MVKIPLSTNDIAAYFPSLSTVQEMKNGGQKAVYSAIHDHYGYVVLKVIPDTGANDRVLREIEIVRQHHFSHVPTIYEAGTVEMGGYGYLYIIEQRIDGADLRMLLESQKRLPLAEVLRCLNILLETVAELEEKRVVHRDIKPDNVLKDRHGCFWLVDFGIARDVLNVSLTATSDHFGPYTAGYAPPEQFQNMKRLIDSRTDLFSIGVTAYELLHGENPFHANANSVIDVLMKTATVTEDPLKIPGDHSGDLSAFIRTLMQKNPSFRPPSANMALAWFREIVKTVDTEILP